MRGFLGFSYGEAPSDGYVLTYSAALGRYTWAAPAAPAWATPGSIGATTPNAGAFTTLSASGATTLTAGTASSSTLTGTLVVTGGTGISGDTYIGGLLNVVGTVTSTGRHNVSLTDANTSTASNLMVVDHASSGTPAAGFGSQMLVRASSSTTASRNQALLLCEWATATDASRAGRMSLWAYDSGGPREGLRVEASGSAPMLGFYGSSAVAKQTVTGSRGANAALASLLTVLATAGLIIDSSS